MMLFSFLYETTKKNKHFLNSNLLPNSHILDFERGDGRIDFTMVE